MNDGRTDGWMDRWELIVELAQVERRGERIGKRTKVFQTLAREHRLRFQMIFLLAAGTCNCGGSRVRRGDSAHKVFANRPVCVQENRWSRPRGRVRLRDDCAKLHRRRRLRQRRRRARNASARLHWIAGLVEVSILVCRLQACACGAPRVVD